MVQLIWRVSKVNRVHSIQPQQFFLPYFLAVDNQLDLTPPSCHPPQKSSSKHTFPASIFKNPAGVDDVSDVAKGLQRIGFPAR